MWQRLRFRDHLHDQSDEAARYEALKRRLAAEHRNDRDAYTAAKSGYVGDAMRKAGGERGN
jgi:GrpB-like predicted nucleotidyltransferase (UPF0157 family)